MATAATNAATAKLPPARVPPLSGTWTIEQRRFLGFLLGAVCVGIIVGNKIGRGTADNEVRVVNAPCADCAERAIQEQRTREYAARHPHDRPLPGNVPPVTFDPTAPPPAPAGQGAASQDISGAIVDTSKSHVVDASFIAGGGDASSVPGQ